MPAEGFTPAIDVRTSMQRGARRPRTYEKAKDPRRALVRLLRYLVPYRLSIMLVLGAVILSSLVGLVGPWLMGRAIDACIGAKDTAGLATRLGNIALLMLAAYAAGNLLQVFANWIMARISQDALKELRRDLFAHLQTLSMSFFDRNPAGGLMSRLTNDIDAVNQAVSQNVINLLTSALTMAGIIVTMFILNHWLAMAVLVVVPIMAWFSGFIAAFTRRGFRDLQRDLGELNAVAEEVISGQKVVKAFRQSGSTTETFRKRNEAVFRAGVYANSYALLLMPLTGVLGNFFVIVLAGLGGWLALGNLVSVGTIATFINYGQNFTQPLRQIANLYNSIQAALAGAERVFEIIDTPAEVDGASAVPDGGPAPVEPCAQLHGDAAPGERGSNPAAPHAPAGEAARHRAVRGDVDFRDVCFSYVPGKPVIRDFSLSVRAGQMVALVGPTGAGKTTIINLLTRFYETGSGLIAVDGTDIRELPKAELRHDLGIVLQDNFLFSDSVMENIRYGRLEASDAECVEAARLAEADHFIRQLPQGYGTRLSERAGNLSQGQRQLLAIARVILADPAILILDEATSSVDTRTELRIQRALLALMKGRTSFVIAHRLSTIRDADLVVVIDGGRIAESGSHDGLLAARGVYWNLYMSQFKGKAI